MPPQNWHRPKETKPALAGLLTVSSGLFSFGIDPEGHAQKGQGLELIVPVIGILHFSCVQKKGIDRTRDPALDLPAARTFHGPQAV